MFYNLLYPLGEEYQIFNLFKYITFRTGSAFFTAFIVSLIIGPLVIRKMISLQNGGQPIRKVGPETHYKKKGTPTMGGLFILLSLVISTFFWADVTNPYVWIILFVTLGYGMLGFADDYLKVTKRNTAGVPGKVKLVCQFAIALIACYLISSLAPTQYSTHLAFPFFKNLLLDLGLFYFFFAAVVVVGASNAVNLTDGLDGLATVPIVLSAVCFGLFSYLVGNSVFSHYLQIHHVPDTGELAIFCGALAGASLGFLWYNCQPAQIFMGDVGSLALGGAIGTVSVITKHEIVLAIVGGLFVIEALSVIIQVYYFKLTGGKRIFLMAPIHHHFEKKGWSETTVVVRFWIISIIFAIIGLTTLKLR